MFFAVNTAGLLLNLLIAWTLERMGVHYLLISLTVLLVVPLLIESGAYRDHVSRILVVDCDEVRQIERVMARSGLSENEVRAIMAVQASRSTRLAAADDVVDNDGPCVELHARVSELHQRYLELSRKS